MINIIIIKIVRDLEIIKKFFKKTHTNMHTIQDTALTWFTGTMSSLLCRFELHVNQFKVHKSIDYKWLKLLVLVTRVHQANRKNGQSGTSPLPPTCHQCGGIKRETRA